MAVHKHKRRRRSSTYRRSFLNQIRWFWSVRIETHESKSIHGFDDHHSMMQFVESASRSTNIQGLTISREVAEK